MPRAKKQTNEDPFAFLMQDGKPTVQLRGRKGRKFGPHDSTWEWIAENVTAVVEEESKVLFVPSPSRGKGDEPAKPDANAEAAKADRKTFEANGFTVVTIPVGRDTLKSYLARAQEGFAKLDIAPANFAGVQDVAAGIAVVAAQ